MKLKDNKNIFASISSGYSSVMMAIKLKGWYPDHNIVFAMANTSKERPESLDFMNKCDKHYSLNLKWVEAIFNHKKNKGVDFRIVDFSELKTQGEVFEDGIVKHGIPSKINKWCNRDMKVEPLNKFADSIFGKNNYSIAVGLRTDEIDRRKSLNYRDNNIFYPLVDNNISYHDRNKFWSEQPIKISIPAFKGNCDMCFEKSSRKLMTIISEEPQLSKWWSDMVLKHGKTPKHSSDSYNDILKKNGEMTFYREYRTIQDLIEMAKHPFSKATDEYIYENDLFDQEEDCGSGCQVF